MSDRDSGVGRYRDRAGHAGNYLDRDTGPDARKRFFAAAAEHERVAALEPDHAVPGLGALHDQRVDLVLGQPVRAWRLACLDDLHVRVEFSQDVVRAKPVGNHDVGLAEQTAAEHGDQAWVARTAADQRDTALARLAAMPSHREFTPGKLVADR